MAKILKLSNLSDGLYNDCIFMDNVSEFKNNSQKTIDYLKEDLKSIRTGHASASLVENIIVETYGGSAKLRLLELSTITAEGPSTLIKSAPQLNCIFLGKSNFNIIYFLKNTA